MPRRYLKALKALGACLGLMIAGGPLEAEDARPEAVTTTAAPPAQNSPASSPGLTMGTFLDRLMLAESGGRDLAANPRSTALGPFQFTKGTFLFVVRRHFGGEVGALSDEQVLALRTDRAFSRRAAEAYTKDNAATLTASGLEATFVRLRLAYLVGAGGAVQVLRAAPDTPVFQLLGAAVLRANPFMIGMKAADLISKAARDLAERPDAPAKPDMEVAAAGAGGSAGADNRPALKVLCDRARASCRKWVALKLRISRHGTRLQRA